MSAQKVIYDHLRKMTVSKRKDLTVFGIAAEAQCALAAAGYVFLSPDDVEALEKIAFGNISGVWQEKFEAAQDISRDILRNLKGEAA